MTSRSPSAIVLGVAVALTLLGATLLTVTEVVVEAEPPSSSVTVTEIV